MSTEPQETENGAAETNPPDQKKVVEEAVPYVVQVDAQEDLDYDLKADSNEETRNNEEEAKNDELPESSADKPFVKPLEESEKPSLVKEGCRNLWVSNLPKAVKAADLKEHFSRAGKVVSATVVMSTRSPEECFGFLQMTSPEDAAKAAEKFNSTSFEGRVLTVEATDRKPPALAPKQHDRRDCDFRPKQSTSGVVHRVDARPRTSRVDPVRVGIKRVFSAIRSLPLRRVAQRSEAVENQRIGYSGSYRERRLHRNFKKTLERASRLLETAKYGASRIAHTSRLVPSNRYNQESRIISALQRQSVRSPVHRPIITRRSPPLDGRDRHVGIRSEPSERPRLVRDTVDDRRRMFSRPSANERVQQRPSPRTAQFNRRSDSFAHSHPAPTYPSRDWPTGHRRSVPNLADTRRINRYSGNYSNETTSSFNQSTYSDCARLNSRSRETMDISRPRPVYRTDSAPRVASPVQRERFTQQSPSARRREDYAAGNSQAARVYPRMLQMTAPSRRDRSRSPPRVVRSDAGRSYPAPFDRSNKRPVRGRSPMHFVGSRPKAAVNYAQHRPESRANWSQWTGSRSAAGPSSSPSMVNSAGGHSWKPVGNSLSFSSSGRRFR